MSKLESTTVATTVKRVRIIRLPSRMVVGSMPAQVGMITENGNPIVRVNEKSVVTRNEYGDWRHTHTLNITVTEARRFGWSS